MVGRKVLATSCLRLSCSSGRNSFFGDDLRLHQSVNLIKALHNEHDPSRGHTRVCRVRTPAVATLIRGVPHISGWNGGSATAQRKP